ncbi:MAG: AAA family ATPase [Candidatus Eremiobacteraeota bacterium]|nr:AAA family ATPase [Candidatus Eremiobacteraeota bacterium]
MRRLRVARYRNLRNIAIEIAADATVVCLVGKNGAGKSNLLDLVRRSAELFGFVPAVYGDPWRKEEASFEGIGISLGFDAEEQSLILPSIRSNQGAQLEAWDGTIEAYIEQPRSEVTFRAGGLEEPHASSFGREAHAVFVNQRDKVHCLAIDSDRSYPSVSQNIYNVMQGSRNRDVSSLEVMRSSAYASVASQYQDWVQYVFQRDLADSSQQIADERESQILGRPTPAAVEAFPSYNEALKAVLPGLAFLNADVSSGSLNFLSARRRVTFERLSSGEREITFIIGQIDRFGLKRGLLTIDEPELHLNPELIYQWIAYLRESTGSGQVWLATHSLEAVDATTSVNAFVLRRDVETGFTGDIVPLSSSETYRMVADTLGFPAFALERDAICIIEGTRASGLERERFLRILDLPGQRYVEAGSSHDVISRHRHLKAIATEESRPIRVGGILDRDARTDSNCKALEESGLFVLPFHEIENIFLEPELLLQIAGANHISGFTPLESIRNEADKLAGYWIYQYTQERLLRRPEMSPEFIEFIQKKSWIAFDQHFDSVSRQAFALLSPIDDAKRVDLETTLKQAILVYAQRRVQSDFWRIVPGKEVLARLIRPLGYTASPAFEKEAFRLWHDAVVSEPVELDGLRAYVRSLLIASTS